MERITGSIVALVTPFTETGDVNYKVLGELIDFHLENKTDAILVLGTTSESPTMSHAEDLHICEFAVDRIAGRVPVIASSGSNSTQTMIEKSMDLQRAGADALLVISPYYNKANKEGMYHHFADVADVTDIPHILYNVPGRTGCEIPIDVVERLSKHENIIGIKEASGNMSYATKVARFCNENFAMYSGNDDIIVPILSVGGSGVISVLANIMPAETHDMVMNYLNGNTQAALDEQLRLLPLINNLFCEVNPIPVKEAMNLMGMNVGGFRLPLYNAAPESIEKIKTSMKEAGLI